MADLFSLAHSCSLLRRLHLPDPHLGLQQVPGQRGYYVPTSEWDHLGHSAAPAVLR